MYGVGAYQGAPAPSPGPSFDQQALQQLTLQLLMQQLDRSQDGEGEAGLAGAGKAFRRLHAMHDGFAAKPEQVVTEYVKEWMDRLGLEPGDRWQMSDVTSSIQWGRFRGLHRAHYHASQIFELMLKGRDIEAQGYMAQYLRALHQVQLDGGGWAVAQHLLPKQDPIDKATFGGTHRQLETIAAYQEALKKLQKAHGAPGDGQKSGDAKGKGGGKAGNKKEGDKGGKDGFGE